MNPNRSAISRRHFLRGARGGLGALALAPFLSGTGAGGRVEGGPGAEPFFRTRGVVLVPSDLTLADWPERIRGAGLNTLGIHGFSAESGAEFVRSEQGQRVLGRCRELGLEVEYELHALGGLLPRTLFAKAPGLFRMDETGARVPDANLCVSSAEAREVVAENAVRWSKVLRPTTSRRSPP